MALAALFVAMGCVLAAMSLGPAGATEPPALIDPDGTLHVPALIWPSSDFWSPEFKQAYLEHMAGTLNTPANFGLPAMNAAKADWEKFHAAVDAALEPSLTWDLQHYRVDAVETTIAGVRVAVLTPMSGIAKQNQGRVLINLHGFAHGLKEGEVESVPVVSAGGIRVITLDYRLEPYFSYPASSEDAEAVYRELLKQHKPGAIGIFGSSGGGVLTSQVVAWLQAKGLPRPGAVGVFWSGLAAAPFPWGKIGDSKMWGFRAFPRSDQSEVDNVHAQLAAAYLGNVSSSDATAYPGSSDAVLAKFPPTLFLTGTRAIDMSPSIVSHARLLKLRVDSSIYVIEGGWHGSNLGRTNDSPEEHDANAYVARWFEQHLSR